jgi:hypothetical protein
VYSPPERYRIFAASTDDLVERRVDEVEELDLGDRAHAIDGHADRGADDPTLAQRGIEAALVAELVLETGGGEEDTALLADVFTEGTTTRSSCAHLGLERCLPHPAGSSWAIVWIFEGARLRCLLEGF